ncbi:MAG: hypothetical protein WBA74_22845 [Cyclobacteriaceae bacterium]
MYSYIATRLLTLPQEVMDQLNIFNRMINEDLSPLVLAADKDFYCDFLKIRFPHFTQYHCLELQKLESTYKLITHRKESFHPTISYGGEITDVVQTPVVKFINQLGLLQLSTVNKIALSEGSGCIRVELMLKESYNNLSFDEARFQYYKKYLEETCTSMRQHTIQQLLSQEEYQIDTYVKNCQYIINNYKHILLKDLIPCDDQLLFQISGKYTITDIQRLIYQSLDDLLLFLEGSFSRYLDNKALVPCQKQLVVASTVKSRINELISSLTSINLDEELNRLLLAPLASYGKMRPMNFTYEELFYRGEYLDTICQFNKGVTLDRKAILRLLWSLNYNSLAFCRYILKQIRNQVQTKCTFSEKLDQLFYYRKLASQWPVTTTRKYNPDLPPLKIQIIGWLEEEISFLERKQDQYGEVMHQHEKSMMNISVAQLAVFVRAFFETGMVKGTRQELLHFTTRHYATEQQENISFASLKGKYYKIDIGTKRKVVRMIKKMLAHVENA